MLRVSSKALRYEDDARQKAMRPILTCLEMCPTQTTIVPTTEDVSISFLPLAHMFERVVQVRPVPVREEAREEALLLKHVLPLPQTVIYGAGGRVGFFQGDIRLLPDDMKTLQPTIFPVVPRLLNRVYDRVSLASLRAALNRQLVLTPDGSPCRFRAAPQPLSRSGC